jgi:F-type H+-transporting ATPase subunit epsilon
MATFSFELVSPEKLLFSGEVNAVVVPATEGSLTVLANHEPFMSTIRPGVIEALQAEQDETGFLPRPTDSLLRAGATVRINSQALAFHGQIGPVLNVDGAGVHVQVQIFGRAVPLVLAESALELVSPAPEAGKSERSAA